MMKLAPNAVAPTRQHSFKNNQLNIWLDSTGELILHLQNIAGSTWKHQEQLAFVFFRIGQVAQMYQARQHLKNGVDVLIAEAHGG